MPIEIVGQQLRIRVSSPKKCLQYGTQDVGAPGKLQRLGCRTKKGWRTQAFRLNLKDYSNIPSVFADLNSIKGLKEKQKVKARRLIMKWWKEQIKKKNKKGSSRPYLWHMAR
jgi:hypothetical protein